MLNTLLTVILGLLVCWGIFYVFFIARQDKFVRMIQDFKRSVVLCLKGYCKAYWKDVVCDTMEIIICVSMFTIFAVMTWASIMTVMEAA